MTPRPTLNLLPPAGMFLSLATNYLVERFVPAGFRTYVTSAALLALFAIVVVLSRKAWTRYQVNPAQFRKPVVGEFVLSAGVAFSLVVIIVMTVH